MTRIELYYSDNCRDCHQIRLLLMNSLPKDIQFKEINIIYPEGKYKANKLNILSVPTIVIDGEVVFIGRITKDELLKEIKNRVS